MNANSEPSSAEAGDSKQMGRIHAVLFDIANRLLALAIWILVIRLGLLLLEKQYSFAAILLPIVVGLSSGSLLMSVLAIVAGRPAHIAIRPAVDAAIASGVVLIIGGACLFLI